MDTLPEMPVSSGHTGEALAAGLADVDGDTDAEAADDGLTLALRATLAETLALSDCDACTDTDAAREPDKELLAVTERDVDALEEALAATLALAVKLRVVDPLPLDDAETLLDNDDDAGTLRDVESELESEPVSEPLAVKLRVVEPLVLADAVTLPVREPVAGVLRVCDTVIEVELLAVTDAGTLREPLADMDSEKITDGEAAGDAETDTLAATDDVPEGEVSAGAVRGSVCGLRCFRKGAPPSRRKAGSAALVAQASSKITSSCSRVRMALSLRF